MGLERLPAGVAEAARELSSLRCPWRLMKFMSNRDNIRSNLGGHTGRRAAAHEPIRDVRPGPLEAQAPPLYRGGGLPLWWWRWGQSHSGFIHIIQLFNDYGHMDMGMGNSGEGIEWAWATWIWVWGSTGASTPSPTVGLTAGGKVSGNKEISWRFRVGNLRNKLKFCRQGVQTMAWVGACRNLLSFLIGF